MSEIILNIFKLLSHYYSKHIVHWPNQYNLTGIGTSILYNFLFLKTLEFLENNNHEHVVLSIQFLLIYLLLNLMFYAFNTLDTKYF